MQGEARIGRRIRRLRVKKGLTQSELAAPDYTHAHVSQIEAGRRPASPAALEHFAKKLGVTLDELVTGRPPGLKEQLELEVHTALQAASAGRIDDSERLAQDILRQARRFQLARIQAKALQVLAVCDELHGDFDAAIDHFVEAESSLAGEPLTVRVDAIAGRCRLLQLRGNTRTAIYLLEQAMEGLERQGLFEPGALMRLHTALVAAYFERGAYEQAAASAEEALRLAPESKDPDRLARMHLNVARIFLDQGRIDDAYASLRKAEELFRELDLKSEVANCHHSRGYLLSRQGKLSEAEREFRTAILVYEEVRSPVFQARSTTELARIERIRGSMEEAERFLNRTFDLLGDTDSIEIAEAQRELAQCRAETDPDEAARLLRRAADLFKESDEQIDHSVTCRMLGDLLIDRDLIAAARAYREGITAIEFLG